jgi:hypothetical protein
MPAAPLLPAIFAGASAVATGVGAYGQYKASRQAAAVDMATANYNANVDKAQAAQLDKNTLENIRMERQGNEEYLSHQAASYASAGVLATSGSALESQITNAGLLEQKIQQQYVDSQQRQQQYYAQAAVGLAEGQAQAQADKLAGNLALINGGAKIAGTLFAAGESGAFSGLGGTGSISPSVQSAGDLGGMDNLSSMQRAYYSPGQF